MKVEFAATLLRIYFWFSAFGLLVWTLRLCVTSNYPRVEKVAVGWDVARLLSSATFSTRG